MLRAGLATALVLLAVSVAARAVDCGDLPRGKNPPPEEIGRAIEEMSFAYGLPTEIVKGIAFQESGVQQWRSDGSFVHNVTDCGLGMMQLTGATAEEFDVERLKTDWRYNLEAGCKVLQAKWQRVLRERWKGKDLPPPDPTILENWYYALSYYQGKRTGEYPGKVFSHIEKRPGVLAKLLPKGVAVSNPEAVIPGFAYGGGYTALAGDRFVLEGGKELKAPTHAGTIGDPALVQKLDAVLAAAEKALAREESRKAIRLFQAVLRIKPDAPAARRAEAALLALAARAREGIVRAEQAAAAGDWAGALIEYEAVEARYLGLAEAEDASARADAIRADPRLRAAAAEIEREKQARFLLAKAESAAARKDWLEALRLLRKASARELDGTAAAAEAANRLRMLEADDAVMAEARARERAKQLREWIALGDAYVENGLTDRAVATYRKVIELAPDTPEAATARRKIAEAEERRGE